MDGVKILFAFHSDLLDQWTVETMWAKIVDEEKGLYRLDSIPFYATGVAWRDIIYAEKSSEVLEFKEVVRPGGHSTVQVIVTGDEPDKEPFRAALRELNCESEGVNAGMFVVDVPADQDYVVVKELLDKWQAEGLIFYAESCLSVVHYYE